MGQGTDSCGGYEHDYNPYEDGLILGDWTQRDGSKINVSKMSVRHLKNSKRIAEQAVYEACFECDKEMWQDWVDVFDKEIWDRGKIKKDKPKNTKSKPTTTRGSKVIMICHCGNEYEARTADINRGWGLSCSKRCASIRREFGRPAAKPK